jgi:hypothetical protein
MPISPHSLIADQSELLHRNAHPQFIVNGRVSSQAFRRTEEDEGQLSVQQDSKANAQVAYERFVARGLKSGGIWSVTVAECDELGLQAYDDPIDGDDSHGLIDLTSFNVSQSRKITDRLAAKARDRGCQYLPSD